MNAEDTQTCQTNRVQDNGKNVLIEASSMRLIFVSDMEFLVAFVSDEKITTVFGHMNDFPSSERVHFQATMYTETCNQFSHEYRDILW